MQKSQRPLVKRTHKFFDGQLEKLGTFHPHIAISVVLRQLIDSYIAKRESMEPPVTIDIDVDIDIEEGVE